MTNLANYLQEIVEAETAEYGRLLAENPSLGVTAIIMAGDNVSAQRMTRAVERGEIGVENALWRVGSYARLDWAIAHLLEDRLIDLLPEIWTSSDPDDTRPEYLALWRRAFERNARRIIRDGERLAKRSPITVFRGQLADEPLGIAWTLNPDVAQSFAEGAAVRRPLSGVTYRARISTRHILAYLTTRGEDELIVDIERAEIIKEQ